METLGDWSFQGSGDHLGTPGSTIIHRKDKGTMYLNGANKHNSDSQLEDLPLSPRSVHSRFET